MDSSPRTVLLVVVLLFIFLTPDQQSIRRNLRIDDQRLEELKRADFDVIANTTLDDSIDGLNLTGFHSDDGYQWQLLPIAQEISRRQYVRSWEDSSAPVYEKLTGQVRGNFQRTKVDLDDTKHINLIALIDDEYFVDIFQRNITESQGKISLTLEDNLIAIGDVKEITATLEIFTESSPGNGWTASLRGVHFSSGAVVMTTISKKFNAIPALPHFVTDEEQFNLSKLIVNDTMTRAWARATSLDVPMPASPDCEMIVWLQPKPLIGSSRYIQQIEDEFSNPDGAPVGIAPPLTFSVVIYSPDCGYILEADPVYGPKAEAYWGLVERLLAAFIIIITLEIALLKRQMEKCATPSTRSRISFYSIGIAAFGDGLILFAMIGLLMIEDQAFSLFALATFLCCIHVAFFEVKFIFDIWTVQVGEPAQALRERQRRTPAPPPPPPTDSLPLPATARTDGAIPLAILPGGEIETSRSTFASLYSRFYFALVNLMFFSLWAMSWPQSLRSAYINVLTFLYLSLWIPQIYRNVMRNCRKALNWEYVIGTSVLRAVPILYWYFDDKNILAADTSPSTALFLLGWSWIQIMILLSQQFLGPRLLVRDSWCPSAYDYHPTLHEDLEADGLPIGALASASEGKDKDDKTRKVFDCAICMNEIDVPVVSKDENTGRSWLEQRNYMVTPCRHIFHSECLEGWMNLRLVCPVCREGLPPL